MNKYLGTKEVLATPMTRGEYNEYRGWELPKNELSQANDAGFLVEYLDGGKANDSRHAGYISWSPADVFHRAYSPIDTWLDRVKQEQAELQVKLDALDKTLNVERKPDFITDQQWIFMTRQQFHMRQYNQILKDRIANASPDTNLTVRIDDTGIIGGFGLHSENLAPSITADKVYIKPSLCGSEDQI